MGLRGISSQKVRKTCVKNMTAFYVLIQCGFPSNKPFYFSPASFGFSASNSQHGNVKTLALLMNLSKFVSCKPNTRLK